MKSTEKVAFDNQLFIILVVGSCLSKDDFTRAVLFSRLEEFAQFPTDITGSRGYIRIDYTNIKKMAYEYEFEQKVREGLFKEIAYNFSSATEFEGDLSDRVIVNEGGYDFFFHVMEYERDAAHGFKIIGPEELHEIPEGEKLGRMVYITIKPEEVQN